LRGRFGKPDRLARLHEVGRDVYLAAVNEDVAVVHHLPSHRPTAGESHTIDDVVEPTLEQLEQVLAGRARPANGLGVIAAELTLSHAIDGLHLLLLKQLDAVFRDLATSAAGPCARWHIEASLQLSPAGSVDVDAEATRQL